MVAITIKSRYNIFVKTNISPSNTIDVNISNILSIISQPVRIQILLVIAEQEACVCHFETILGLRQASISQHLMILRKAGLVASRRDGRNIFYHLAQPEVLAILEQTAFLIGANPLDFQALKTRPVPHCPCPQCNPGLDPELTCSNQSKSINS